MSQKRKVTIYVTARLVAVVEDGVEINDMLNEMDYLFTPQPEHGELVDSELLTMGAEVEEHAQN